jgi:hypothetical protein
MSVQGPLEAVDGSALRVATRTVKARPSALSARGAGVGVLGLAGLLSTTVVVALAAAHTGQLLPETVRPLPTWLAGPFGTTGFGIGAGGVILVLVAMFASYVLTVHAADRLSPRWILMAIAAMNALVLLAPPLLSTDVFSYQFYGRMGALYGANPYLAGPHALALDPLFPYIGAKWSYTPTVYGPLFTLLSYALAPLSIAASALAYKAIAACASLGTVALVWNASRLRGVDPARAVALVGLNPLVVVYGVGGAHNDLLMLLALMAGVYLLLARRERAGSATVVAAAAIKLTAALPLLFAFAGRGGRRDRDRRRDVATGASLALVAAAGVAFALFGAGPLHMFATLQRVQSEGDWHSIPGFISTRLGLGEVGHAAGIALAVAFGLTVLWLLRRVWQGRIDWIAASGWSAVALLITAGSLLPWYVAWLMPLAALSADRRLWWTAIGLTGAIQLIQLVGYLPHGL